MRLSGLISDFIWGPSNWLQGSHKHEVRKLELAMCNQWWLYYGPWSWSINLLCRDRDRSIYARSRATISSTSMVSSWTEHSKYWYWSDAAALSNTYSDSNHYTTGTTKWGGNESMKMALRRQKKSIGKTYVSLAFLTRVACLYICEYYRSSRGVWIFETWR